ncbi:hypothetical protein [Candidatus Tisiphia endosymbiont of Sialis lutaria]|uniref:hypothetical protein n=1 Tax=Candidatus Tisiphia endosymbiont of Sialis lutaria TaxID=2029164 RepID=UPI00312C9F7A
MKKSNFNNYIHISHQTGSRVFSEMVHKLDHKFDFQGTEQSEDFTGSAFTTLYQITINFYKTHFPILYQSFIPLYLSLWKLRVKDTIGINNMHQDGGIQYFAKNGYQSRMITLWTNLYKDHVTSLSDNDLGIYVIDNKNPHHQNLYENMARKNTHFYQKGSRELSDIRQIGSVAIPYDLDSLSKQYFDYSEGTTIQFNSHLLHGTKSLEMDKLCLQLCDFSKYRVSLTSVWIHQHDFNQKVLEMHAEDYEQLYLSGISKKDWYRIKNLYASFCQKETMRLQYITELIRFHFSYNNPFHQQDSNYE